MDSCLPDWNTELGVEIPLSCQMKPLGVDHNDLVELLWQNGEVVLNSQNHRKPSHDIPKFKSNGNLNNPIQEDETPAWMNCPIDEAFEKEFCAKLMSETPLSNPLDATHLFPSSYFTPIQVPPPPPRFTQINAPPENQNLGQIRNIFEGYSQVTHNEIPVCSGITIGSSRCGSNQVANAAGYKKIVSQNEQNEIETETETETETREQPITSSSGGSGCSSVWKTSNQSNDNSRQKRKSIDMEESECRSDGTASNKSSQKSGTTRKSRVAEVHNLSERRRRDRINDKMKALQELIPHSNKSDKASVLDEAIEYMKSLQLQLQLMWMGRGMAPMMIPAMENYISRMGLGMAPTTLPQVQDLMRLQRFPSVQQAITLPSPPNQATTTQSQTMSNPVNYQNQMQNLCFPEQYANYMGYQSMQNSSQPMNMLNFGSHSAQQNHVLTRPSNVNGYIG